MIFLLVKLNKNMRLLFCILLVFVFSFSYGQDLPEWPNPPKLVNDFANILSDRENGTLERKLVAYNDSTSTQIAVVTINSLNGDDIANYSFLLAEKWGIGTKGKDNGVLILVAMQDRKMFIATGYGMEGVLTDALAKRIVENFLKPNFRNNNYYKGIDDATTVIIGLASGLYTADQIAGSGNNTTGRSRLIFPLFFFLFFIVMSYSRFRNVRGSHMAGSNMNFITFLLMSSMGGRRGRGYDNFSSGSGPFGGGGGGGFGGFGGGGFGGGGAGGSW
jgi:uncharacterized protein